MEFSSIFIANLAEVARPLAHLMNQKRAQQEILEDHALCDRFLFSNDDNRLLVTPYPIDETFLRDACQLLGFNNVTNAFPRFVDESLCEAILSDKKLLQKIILIVQKNPGIKIISYAATNEFNTLINVLRKKKLKFSTPEMADTDNLWTQEYFDSKSGFRQAVFNFGKKLSAMPEGYICHGRNEIVTIAHYFLKKGTGCVIKTDKGLAGAGLRIIRKNEKVSLSKESFWNREPAVVEEFIEPDQTICGGAPNIELVIKNKSVILLYTCGIRITAKGIFRGVEMGRGAVPHKISSQLLKYGKTFGTFLLSKGYRGFFEVDFVIDKQRRLYPLEANLRRTGGTHVFELAQRLLGNNFLKNYYIVANNITPALRFKNQPYSTLKNALSDYLYPQRGKKEGVIISIVRSLVKGNIGYIVIGPSKKRVATLEHDFLSQLV